MKLLFGTVCGFAALLSLTSNAQAQGWGLTPATDVHGLQLIFGSENSPVYEFECGAADISVTNFGVTELLDLQTGQKIEDTPGAVITPGASLMALFTGKGQPDFLPAEAKPNAVKGWDLTIRFAKTDKRIKVLGKSDMISLFTTGYTAAVSMSAGDQAIARDFLGQCQKAE